MVDLKDFQKDAVSALATEIEYQLKTKNNEAPRLVFQSPTGSGKTVILGETLKRIFAHNDKAVVLWVSIGTGKLHNQSKEKLENQLSGDIQVVYAEETVLGGDETISGKSVVVVSWQSINSKKNGEWDNVIMRDNEKLNFRELIYNTRLKQPIILVIDEAHIGTNSIRSEEIIDTFNPNLILEVTATPRYKNFKKKEVIEEWFNFTGKRNSTHYRGYRVDTSRVISEGMICKRLVINEGVNIENESETMFEVILNAAYQKHLELRKGYSKYRINPLLLVQIPVGEAGDVMRSQVEAYFEGKGITVQNGKMNIWLSEEHEVSPTLNSYRSDVEVLIFKQAINTGWDCPRAKILVQLRDVKNEDTQIQTVGRILRMPQHKFYKEEELNQAYIFTDISSPIFEEDIVELGIVKNLKATCNKELETSLKSYYHGKFSYGELNVEDIKQELRNALNRHFNINFNHYAETGENEKVLERNNQGFVGGNISTELAKGQVEVDKLDKVEFEKLVVFKEKENVRVENKKMFKQLLKPFGDFEMNYATLKTAITSLLKHHVNESISISDVDLHISLHKDEWETCLKEALKSYIDSHKQKATYNSVLSGCHIPKESVVTEWNLPKNLYFSSETYEEVSMQNYAYDKCYLRVKRSNPEIEFEKVLQKEESIKWWFKNGDSGREFLGISYIDKDGAFKTFYPDYLIQLEDKLVVYEVKGYGNENKDENIETKALSLIEFIEVHQKEGIEIAGAIISPNKTEWYEYKVGKASDYKSIDCWEKHSLFK